jgi:hypothetical protein
MITIARTPLHILRRFAHDTHNREVSFHCSRVVGQIVRAGLIAAVGAAVTDAIVYFVASVLRFMP